MAILTPTAEAIDLGAGRFQNQIQAKPVFYRESGVWRRNANNFIDGDATYPHIIDTGPFLSRITDQGDWRIHPTRDPAVWFQIGAPFVNPAAPVRATLNPFTRTGNTLTSVNTNFNARITNGGHFIKLEWFLKNGYVPPQSKIAFPISAQGITRVGTALQANGVTFMNLTPPTVYDAANKMDVRPITQAFQSVSGQLYIIYTLPSLTGMAQPVIDPTLSLQPDATAGIDAWVLQLAAYVDTNFGTHALIAIGNDNPAILSNYHQFIKFDLSSITDTGIISSATLSLYANTDYSNVARTYRVYRIKRAWTELGVTWNKYDGTNAWQTAGGTGANDYDSTEIGNRAFTTTETLNVFKDFTLTPTTKANLDLGNGWMIKADVESDDAYYFDSSDGGTAGQRPKLVVVYTLGTTYTWTVAGTLTSSGVLVKATGKPLAGAVTPSGALSRNTGKKLAGGLTSSGVLTKIAGKLLAGTLSSSGALTRRTGKALGGLLTTTGGITKRISRILSGVLTWAGSVTHRTGEKVDVTVSDARLHTVTVSDKTQ